MHAKRDALGGVVGADDRLASLIAKFERTELVGLTCGEHCASFLTVVAHLRDAEGAHRHPEVGQQAAEPIEGEFTQRRQLQEREQQAGHQPEAHHIGEDAVPVTGKRSLFQIGKANEPAAKQAKQRRQQSVESGMCRKLLPAQARQLGHQPHQAEGQRHEDGIEIGGTHRERA